MDPVIWEGNLKPKVLEACKKSGCSPTQFELPDIKVQIYLNDVQGALRNALAKDPLLKARMMEAGGGVVGDLAQLMAYWVGMTENEMREAANEPRLAATAKRTKLESIVARLPNNLAQTKQQILPKIQAAALKEWQELCSARSEYRKYLIQAGVNIVAGTAKIVTKIAAGVATSGGALVLGIVGLVGDAVGTASEIYNLGKEAETVQNDVFKSLFSTLNKKGSDTNFGKLITSVETIARKLGPTDLFVDTPVKCQELNKRYEHKLQGLETKAHDTATNLNTALEKSDQLKHALDREERDRLKTIAAASPSRDALGRRGAMSRSALPNPQPSPRAQALESLAGMMQRSIEKVQRLFLRVKTGKDIHEAYARFIADLMRERVPTFVPQLAEGIGLAAEAFSPQWQDTVREACVALAKTYGPEVANQAVDRFQQARQGGDAGLQRKAPAS